MFILWRYILKEHIGPFLFAMSVIILVFLLNLVFRELSRILSRGLGFGLILEFFFLNMAWIIALAVPMAVLVAALMAFGRLSGDNEIVAMKANGISVLYIMFPVLIASLGLTVFLVWFNNNVLPDFNHRARLLASDIARKRPTLSLESGVIYRDLPNYNLLVQSIQETPDTAYVDSVFIEDNSDPNISKIIFADNGKIYLNHHSGMLTLILYDGELHELDLRKMEQYRKHHLSKQVLSISVPNLVLERSQSDQRGDREKSAQMMLAEVDKNKTSIVAYQEKIHEKITRHFRQYFPWLSLQQATKDSQSVTNTNPDLSTRLDINRIMADLMRLEQSLSGELGYVANLERQNYVLMVEIHKKYSIPVACIVFVLVGAPLGIMARRGSMAMAGGISFSFFLLYWASLIGGEELADNRFISPFMAMWLANIIVGIGGIYLVVHAIYEATLLNWISLKSIFKTTKKRGYN